MRSRPDRTIRAVLSMVALSAVVCSCSAVQERAQVAVGAPRLASCPGELVDYHRRNGGLALLVIERGRELCADFAEAASAGTVLPLFSGTKSFHGALLAAAVNDGLLTADEPAADTLEEWRRDPIRSQITIGHLLSLSSGLAEAGPRAAPSFAASVAVEGAAFPGTAFAYGPISFQIFGELLRRKLRAHNIGLSPTEYLERRVLAPLGITRVSWGGPVAGSDPNLAAGASMSARDWARFGTLAINPDLAGRLGLDASTFAAQFTPRGAYAGYGWGWWLANPAAAGTAVDTVAQSIDLPMGAAAGYLPRDLVAAAGAGGQRLYVSRSLQLVVVRLAAPPDLSSALRSPARSQAVVGAQFSDTEFLRRLLPAKPAAVDRDPRCESHNRERRSGQG